MKLTFDIEANGLLDTIDKIWCLVAEDVDTNDVYLYSDYDDDLESIEEGLKLLKNATALIGHNIIGYDIPAIKIVTGVDLSEKKCYDTWVMSQTLRYKRTHKHGLKGWGEHLGDDKLEFDDFEGGYTQEMLTYCIQDVNLNTQVYYQLIKEFQRIKAVNPLISKGLEVEHGVAKFNAIVTSEGWNFDVEKANVTLKKMVELSDKIEAEIEPQLGTHVEWIDKKPKTPKYKKNGNYNTVTCRLLTEYLGRPVEETDTHLVAPGVEFQRSKVVQTKLGQLDYVKEWLEAEKGWKPDDWTRKKLPNGRWVSVSPKFTETSMKPLGELGEMISNYYTLRNRISVLKSWLEVVKDGRIHGGMFTIGTPSFRCRHSVIVNLPGVHATWGKELRELFAADDGWEIVGADSSGNQLRGLCHYVNNKEFTEEVVNGDQHQRNADALSLIVKGTTRPTAKSYLYAYLFGAGDAKLGQVLTGKSNSKIGAESKDAFSSSIKGLAEAKARFEREYNKNKHQKTGGWFYGLDGRPVFVSSEHQCLNYALQTMEGITCKAATVYQMEKIKEEGLRAKPRIFYHDETAWTVHPDDAVRVGEILQESFREAPKWFGVECMDGGDYVIGDSYADVH